MGRHYSKTKRKAKPQTVMLTDRDVVVIEALFRFVILSTDQLFQLAGGGRDGFRKRMRLLYDAGFVARPSIQNELFRYGAKRPTIYTLGKEGAEYLKVVCGLAVPTGIDWERKARDRKGMRGQFKVLHDLGANGAVISLNAALSAVEGIVTLSPDELVKQSPDWTQKAKFPFSIPTRFKWVDGRQHDRTVIPDGMVAYIDHRMEAPVKALLFIEFDQEMDVNRSDVTQSSIRQKIACYSSMFKDNTVKKRFGFDAFRVLFVTSGSSKHLQTMCECCQEYRTKTVRDVPAFPFFFSTVNDLDSAENPLSNFWRDGGGVYKGIIRLD